MKQLKERERKMAEQGRDLEKAIAVLNNKLREEDSPKLLKVSWVLELIIGLNCCCGSEAGGNVSVLRGGGGE